jgi:hypothetical protein
MAVLLAQLSVTNGLDQVRAVSWYQSDLSSAIQDAVCAASTAIADSAYQTVTVPIGVPAQQTFTSSPLDVARLTFRSAAGNVAHVQVPAADPACYLVDGETVDPSASLIAPLIGYVLAHGCTAAGEALAVFVSGKRLRLPATPVGMR